MTKDLRVHRCWKLPELMLFTLAPLLLSWTAPSLACAGGITYCCCPLSMRPTMFHAFPCYCRYLDDTIAGLRKGITKAEMPAKAKKGEAPAPAKKVGRGVV